MARSAQDRFNQYLDEYRMTQASVNAVSDASREYYEDYAYAAGYFGSMVADLIAQLPKAQRAEYRNRLDRASQDFRNKILLKQIAVDSPAV